MNHKQGQQKILLGMIHGMLHRILREGETVSSDGQTVEFSFGKGADFTIHVTPVETKPKNKPPAEPPVWGIRIESENGQVVNVMDLPDIGMTGHFEGWSTDETKATACYDHYNSLAQQPDHAYYMAMITLTKNDKTELFRNNRLMVPIPDNVYYNEQSEVFVGSDTPMQDGGPAGYLNYYGMGTEFFNRWQPRRSEFPKSVEELQARILRAKADKLFPLPPKTS